MKKLLYLFVTAFTLLFTACIDSEEKISLNEDGSGTYKITMDMSKMISMLSAFGGDEKKKIEKKDTVIYFKDYADTSTTLTAEEKEIMRTGKLTVNMDSEKGEMKIVIDALFKNGSQLSYLRTNLQDMVGKTKAMDKLNDKKEDKSAEEGTGGMDMTPKMGAPKNNVNPFKDYYEFKATANSLWYVVKDKAAAMKALETNEDLQMMKKMAPMMGDMTFSTVIELPHSAKKVEGPNAKLSDDKKTVTVAATFKQIFANLDAMSFKVEY
ncbi:MAG: hypothetical protein EKK37_09210 [Sphingobacteriales bacterium]|nr:MAG: hypothetical protein EKK37_09210 [Sphingobacteriales bacterium]